MLNSAPAPDIIEDRIGAAPAAPNAIANVRGQMRVAYDVQDDLDLDVETVIPIPDAGTVKNSCEIAACLKMETDGIRVTLRSRPHGGEHWKDITTLGTGLVRSQIRNLLKELRQSVNWSA